MNTLKALFLGGARRVGIARQLKRAAADLGFNLDLWSYELSVDQPIALEAKVVVGRRWSATDIYSHLGELIAAEGIDIVLPFVDQAVAVAADIPQRRPYGRVFVPASTGMDATIMFDKVSAAHLFEELGLPIPATWHPGEAVERLIAKPRYGSASKGIVNVDSQVNIDALSNLGAYLVQQRIDRRCEYTVDCYVSVDDGRVLAVSPRRRLEVIGGEVCRTVTVDEPDVEQLARRTLAATGLRGAVTVQILRDLDHPERLMLMEINPRLGGGVVCSVQAGADIARLIVQEALGIPMHEMKARPGVEMVRWMDAVFFEK